MVGGLLPRLGQKLQTLGDSIVMQSGDAEAFQRLHVSWSLREHLAIQARRLVPASGLREALRLREQGAALRLGPDGGWHAGLRRGPPTRSASQRPGWG